MGTGQKDSCSDPKCYAAKLDAHIRQTIAAKPKLVQISTAYGQQKEGSTTLPRNKYVEVRQEKPKTKEEATRPEFKTCKYTTEAIVSEGSEKGELRKVCTQADCPVHHAKKRSTVPDPKGNAEEQKRRREEALAQATGLRTLAAIVAAVPVRLMKRDLLFVVERLAMLLDERRLEIIARQRGIKKAKDSDSIGKLFTAYMRRAEEGALSGLLVEITILHAATRQNAAQVLRDATTAYKVDVDAISLKVKQVPAHERGLGLCNPITSRPYFPTEIQKRHLKPLGIKLGLGPIGWHTFRHTYRSWLDETGAPMKVQQELMRHASIQTTMNVYGQAMPASKREANGKVVEMVLKPMKASA
jgi:hypothetical protein